MRLQQARLNQHSSRKGTQSDSRVLDPPHGRPIWTEITTQPIELQMAMEATSGIAHPPFFAHHLANIRRLAPHLGVISLAQSIRQFRCRERLVWQGLRARAGSRHNRAPKRLVAKERDDDRGPAQYEPCRGRAGAAVVDDTRDILEQPVVRTAPDHVDVRRDGRSAATDITPSCGDNGAHACFCNSLENDLGEPARVVDYYGPKADIYGWVAGTEKGLEIGRGIVCAGAVEEAESADVDAGGPVGGFGEEGGRPCTRIFVYFLRSFFLASLARTKDEANQRKRQGLPEVRVGDVQAMRDTWGSNGVERIETELARAEFVDEVA